MYLLILSLDSIIALFTTIFTFIGGIFALVQWKHANKIKRTEFIYQLIEKLRTNKEVASTLYMIEYGKFNYDASFHGNLSLEQEIDKALSYLSYICYLYQRKVIKKNEFNFFRYRMIWICRNPHIQAYLWNIHHFSEFNKSVCPFSYLIDFGIKDGAIPKNFKNNSTDLYNKHLDF